MSLEEDQAFLDKMSEIIRELGFWYQKKWEEVSYQGKKILTATEEQKKACDTVISVAQQNLLDLVTLQIQNSIPGNVKSQDDILADEAATAGDSK
jgi:hypothetical protein